MKFTNIDPLFDKAKSFYGKAKLAVDDAGIIYLKSYSTIVASLVPDGHGFAFRRHWGGYSPTTMRHINSFLHLHGVTGGGKAWWDAQDVVSFSVKTLLAA